MRTNFLTVAAILFLSQAYTQNLSQVFLQGGKDLKYFSIRLDGQVLLRLSPEGKILEYGMEEPSLRNPNYFAPKLQPYAGRVDKFGNEADSAFKGNIRSIGPTTISYYPSYENEFRRGKIRSIGNLMFDYFDIRATETQKGKISQIGRSQIDYYAPFDNPAIKGKLKSIGNTTLTYYTNFDDKAIAGKVKSIGTAQYSWYTSLERQGMGGALKSGNQRQQVADVTFIIQ